MVDITKEITRKLDEAFKVNKNAGLGEDALWLKLQEDASITDEQRDAFRRKESPNSTRASKMLWTLKQYKNLPTGQAPGRK